VLDLAQELVGGAHRSGPVGVARLPSALEPSPDLEQLVYHGGQLDRQALATPQFGQNRVGAELVGSERLQPEREVRAFLIAQEPAQRAVYGVGDSQDEATGGGGLEAPLPQRLDLFRRGEENAKG
jgi:hypothetical protein